MKYIFNILAISIAITSLTSCATQNLLRSEMNGQLVDLIRTEDDYHHIIKTDDKVSFSVWNHDDMSIGSVFSIYNSNEAYGKWVLVDDEGFVQLPKIGKFHIRGMTCPEAAEILGKKYAKFLVDPIIVVKILNREITVLGEVRTSGNYILEKERNTITELIGRAQGFRDYADLEKVQLIRNGIGYDLDLTKLSPDLQYAIVVESGDIINIPSLRRKGLDQKAPTLIPFASTVTALSILATFILR